MLRDSETLTVTVTAEPVEVVEPLLRSRVETIGQLGVLWSQHSAVVDVAFGSPAAAAGLLTFDRIVQVGDTPVTTWLELEAALASREGSTPVTVQRPVALGEAWFTGFTHITERLTLPSGDMEGLGLRVASATIMVVEEGSPAMAAGLKRGDRIVGWNDTDISAVDVLLARIEARPDETHTLRIERDGAELTMELTPLVQNVVAEFRSEREETFVGFDGVPGSLAYVAPTPLRMGVIEGVVHGAWRALVTTGEYLVAIFLGVVFLIIGSMDSSNLGGPLMIADVANRAARAGLLPFVELMAKISINLGIVNLVPVPGLDGGNLALLAAESVKKGAALLPNTADHRLRRLRLHRSADGLRLQERHRALLGRRRQLAQQLVRVALDTSTRVQSVALETPDGAIVARAYEAPQHSRALVGSIRGLLEEHGAGWGDVSAYVVGLGPGSFTGSASGSPWSRG